uniref:Pentacotripeptide-repeat region of PRORP domain-containing protein n=1 Tax=Emiliania huxleyi (strain CCMP1516) TaxID=280463 RepID=A0A0D3K5Y1_EMIH1
MQAADVLRRMREGGVTPDAISYAAIVQAHVNGGSVDGARAALDEAVESGTRLDAAVFNALLGGYASELRWSDASELVRAMAARGVPPDGVQAFSMVLSAYAHGGRIDEAIALLRRMQTEGLAPNGYTFSAMMEACVNGGQPETARAVFDQMEEQGIAPDAASYTLLVRAHTSPQTARADHLAEFDIRAAREVLVRMIASGVPPNVATYNALLA